MNPALPQGEEEEERKEGRKGAPDYPQGPPTSPLRARRARAPRAPATLSGAPPGRRGRSPHAAGPPAGSAEHPPQGWEPRTTHRSTPSPATAPPPKATSPRRRGSPPPLLASPACARSLPLPPHSAGSATDPTPRLQCGAHALRGGPTAVPERWRAADFLVSVPPPPGSVFSAATRGWEYVPLHGDLPAPVSQGLPSRISHTQPRAPCPLPTFTYLGFPQNSRPSLLTLTSDPGTTPVPGLPPRL
jgi:hypothetical protein